MSPEDEYIMWLGSLSEEEFEKLLLCAVEFEWEKARTKALTGEILRRRA